MNHNPLVVLIAVA